MTDLQVHLDKIRSDAAECLSLSSDANNDKREMLAKMANHLENLAHEVERSIADCGPPLPLVERGLNELVTDKSPTQYRSVASNHSSAPAGQATRSRRFFPWMLIVVVMLVVGVSFRINEHVSTFLPLLTWQSKQVRLLAQVDPEQVSDDGGEQRLITGQINALTAPVGSFGKVLNDLKTVRTEGESARHDLESNTALLKASDETAQFKKSFEATTTALQEERKKTAALTDDLATARRDLQTKAEASNQTAELKRIVETATAGLQEERRKAAALTNDLAATRRDLQTKVALLSYASDETAELRKKAETATTALQEERKKIAALASIDPGKTSDSIAEAEAGSNPVPPASEKLAKSGSEGNPEATHLMVRAQSLLSRGDINGARIFLERAMEMGSAKAIFATAETYDPRVLSHLNVYGIRGDAAKARELYAKAAAGGIEEAKGRMAALHE